METKHAPEPWVYDTSNMSLSDTEKANVARAAACVNACAGLNPDAVPGLVEALRKADAWIAMYHNTPGHDAASRQMSTVIRAALAQAEVVQ